MIPKMVVGTPLWAHVSRFCPLMDLGGASRGRIFGDFVRTGVWREHLGEHVRTRWLTAIFAGLAMIIQVVGLNPTTAEAAEPAVVGRRSGARS